MQVDNIGILSKGNDEIRHRRADIANHHAAHNQQRHLPHALRDEQHKAHREHGSRKGGCYHDGRAEHAPAGQCAYHRQRDRQLSSRGNTQHERSRDRIGEKGLQQKAGDRQRTAEQDDREDTRQANLPHETALSPLCVSRICATSRTDRCRLPELTFHTNSTASSARSTANAPA